jgi:DNA-binding transcriptional ArsR family regulator
VARTKPKTRGDLLDRRLARAIGHPIRVEILVEVDRAPMSPNEFARRTGHPLATVAYHFRELQKCGCLEVVEEVPRRGATEHFYEVTKRALFSAKSFASLPAAARGGFSAATIACFMRRAQEALEAHTFDSHDSRHLTWRPLALDEEGFARVMAMLDDLYAALGVEQLAARERLAESGERPVHTTVGLAGFESPAPQRETAAPRATGGATPGPAASGRS